MKRETEAFSVKNASKHRRPEDGTTIVKVNVMRHLDSLQLGDNDCDCLCAGICIQ
jgi:hypothetical protein